MQRTYNLNKNVTKLRMKAKASSRQIGDFLIWFLRLNKKQYFAELISSLGRFLNGFLRLLYKAFIAYAAFYRLCSHLKTNLSECNFLQRRIWSFTRCFNINDLCFNISQSSFSILRCNRVRPLACYGHFQEKSGKLKLLKTQLQHANDRWNYVYFHKWTCLSLTINNDDNRTDFCEFISSNFFKDI